MLQRGMEWKHAKNTSINFRNCMCLSGEVEKRLVTFKIAARASFSVIYIKVRKFIQPTDVENGSYLATSEDNFM